MLDEDRSGTVEVSEVESMILKADFTKNPVSEHERPFLSTFHSLGVYILRHHGKHIGISQKFKIIDKDDAKKIVRDALKESGYDIKQYEPNKILGIISKQKGDFVSPDEVETDFEEAVPESSFNSFSKVSKSPNSKSTLLDEVFFLSFINSSIPGPKFTEELLLLLRFELSSKFNEIGSKSFNPISITSILSYVNYTIFIFKFYAMNNIFLNYK
jgi:hypothetical protein